MTSPATPYFPLLKLPGELCIEILRYLDLKHLFQCRLVCKALKETIQHSLELQYKIELEADGLIDGVGCTLSLAERYELLLERRRRWRTLDWTQVVPVPAPALCQAYELVDGVFASSMATMESEFAGGSRHLSITRLPTSSEPAQTIEREDIGFPVRDFAIDPSQDLVALVLADAFRDEDGPRDLVVRLHTISENKPHPQAAVPELTMLLPSQMDSSFIQIVDDVVGIFFWMHGPGLVIWNWRTGQTMVRQLGFDFPTGTYDFAFLSSRAYMITVTSGSGSIDIYAFGDGPNSHHPPILQPPTKVAVLRMPPIKVGQSLRRFKTHSGPFVARPTRGRAFETAPECRLHVMEVTYGSIMMRFNMFVRHRFLMAYIPHGVGSGATDYQPVTKEWDEWGPDNTRLITILGRFQWLRYVHGERVILPSLPTFGPTPGSTAMTLMVENFNVHPKRLDDPVPLQGVTGTAKCVLNMAGEPIVAEGLFEAPVESKLPFATVVKTLPLAGFDYSGFMVDQEHLVGMRSGDGGYVNLDVYTF